MGQVRAVLKWADSRKVKEEIDLQILTLLGPKREEDLVKPAKGKPEKKDTSTKPEVAQVQHTGETTYHTLNILLLYNEVTKDNPELLSLLHIFGCYLSFMLASFTG